MIKKVLVDEEVFLTATQAAKILNVSIGTLKKFIYQGKIRTLKTPGGHHRIQKEDLFLMKDKAANYTVKEQGK